MRLAEPLCQTLSHADGASWSLPQAMDGPVGVEPKLRVLKSGRIALSTGRPGLYLYVASDPPTRWQSFNVAAAHNKLVADPTLKFYSDIPGGGTNGTTSYTGLVVAKGGEGDAVYVSYDRLGNGWGTIEQGQASAVFVMRLAIGPAA